MSVVVLATLLNLSLRAQPDQPIRATPVPPLHGFGVLMGQPSSYNSHEVCANGRSCVDGFPVSRGFRRVLANCLKSALRSRDEMGYRSAPGYYYYYYRFPSESPGPSWLEHNIFHQLEESSTELNRTLIMRGSFISPARAQTGAEADK